MAIVPRPWRPGSFTKNFSWGQAGKGLVQLHSCIRAGFDNKLKDTSRQEFRSRIRSMPIPDYVPINFFLGNEQRDKNDFIIVDELVYWAVTKTHTTEFDRLATFALNLSLVGQWGGANPTQRYPAEWAKHYIVEKIYKKGKWNTASISADDIESYIISNSAYKAQGARKIATNLAYIYSIANISSFRIGAKETWWGSAVFLALDRILLDRHIELDRIDSKKLLDFLREEYLFELTAVPFSQGKYIVEDIIDLYMQAGGRARFAQPNFLQNEKPYDGKTDLTYLEILNKDKERRPIDRIFASANVQVRDRSLVQHIRSMYKDSCAACGNQLKVDSYQTTYCEVGHIMPVGKPINGPDHLSNLLPFCPNHHRMFDRGGLVFEIESNKLVVRDRVGNTGLGGRMFSPHQQHNLDLNYLTWHAKYFS